MEYEMAGGILDKAMNAVLVERMNEKNAKGVLENLKQTGSPCETLLDRGPLLLLLFKESDKSPG